MTYLDKVSSHVRHDESKLLVPILKGIFLYAPLLDAI